MLPPLSRLPEVRSLIDEGLYFVIHAPRQSGKTTFLRAMATELAAEGRYTAIYASCERAQAAGGDVERAVQSVCRAIELQTRHFPPEQRPTSLDEFDNIEGESRLRHWLTDFSERHPRPIVLFLDEVDALWDQSLVSVLRQLRDGYVDRPAAFPHAIALVGLRDVRDYRAELRPESGTLGTASPFNIKSDSLLMPDFDEGQVSSLLGQHEDETGQAFTDDAARRVWQLTRGQPWLVNAIARQATRVLVPERSKAIDEPVIDEAKEKLILRRDTHLDSLIERLREERVQRVVGAVISGRLLPSDVLDDDIAYVENLGLLSSGSGGLEIANPIYREIVPRALTSVLERSMVLPSPSYVHADGGLDFPRLIDDFETFWLQHAEAFLRRSPYSEAAAQLVFMAFLHKITNGKGGFVDREYAAGSGRVDLCIRWPRADGVVERFAIELKVWREGTADPVDRGVEQLAAYLQRLDLGAGTLVIFDSRPQAPPLPERLRREQRRHGDALIDVLWL